MQTRKINSRLNILFVISAIFFVLLANFFVMNTEIGTYDEGLILVAAERILGGDLPYKNFWGMYAPGQFYVVAALFDLFGHSALVERIYDLVIRTTIVLLSFAVARAILPRSVSYAVAGAVFVATAAGGSYAFPVFPALACSLLATLALFRSFCEPAKLKYSFLTGMACGGAALFRHDMGFYLLVACFVAIVAEQFLLHRSWSSSVLKLLLALIAGTSLIAAPALIALLSTIPAADLYQNLISIPAFVYPKVRALPFPNVLDTLSLGLQGNYAALRQTAVFVPPLAVALALATNIRPLMAPSIRDGGSTKELRLEIALLVLTVFSALLFIKGMVRISAEHTIQSYIFALILIAGCARLAVTKRLFGRVPALFAVVFAIPSLVGYAQPLVVHAIQNLGSSGYAQTCQQPVHPKLRCLRAPSEQLSVANYVDRITEPDERIYVGVGRHDRLFANDIILYFLADRLPATKWHELHPGVQTTASIQREMFEEFQNGPLGVAVVNPAWDSAIEKSDQKYSSGINIVDAYIDDMLTETAKFGPYIILTNR